MADKKVDNKNNTTPTENKTDAYEDVQDLDNDFEEIDDTENFEEDDEVDDDFSEEEEVSGPKNAKSKVIAKRVGIAIGCVAVLALVLVGVVYGVIMHYYNLTHYVEDDQVTTMAVADAETYSDEDDDVHYVYREQTDENGEVIGTETVDYNDLDDDEKESVDAQIEEELSQAADDQQSALDSVANGELYLPAETTEQTDVLIVNQTDLEDEYDEVLTDDDGNVTSVVKDGTTYNVVSSSDDSVVVVKDDASSYTVNTDDDGNVTSIEKNGETYDITVKDDGETTVTQVTSTDETDSDVVTVDTTQTNDVYNILLIGADTRANSSESGNADVIVLVSVNKTKGTINMISFMRDLYANIPGYGADKINHAYRYGGGPLLVQTIEENYGVSIDNYACVDFYSMIDIVDALGGITLTLSADEVEATNSYITALCKGTSMTASDYYLSGSGSFYLNGVQTVAYCRIRNVGNYEFERTERHRKVLAAIFSALQGRSASEINSFLNTALPYVTHNISSNTLMSLLASAPTYLTYSLNSYRVPFDGYWSYSGTIKVPDFSYTISKLYSIIYY